MKTPLTRTELTAANAATATMPDGLNYGERCDWTASRDYWAQRQSADIAPTMDAAMEEEIRREFEAEEYRAGVVETDEWYQLYAEPATYDPKRHPALPRRTVNPLYSTQPADQHVQEWGNVPGIAPATPQRTLVDDLLESLTVLREAATARDLAFGRNQATKAALDELDAALIAQITAETDEEKGKPIYSNETSRKAELLRRRGDYQATKDATTAADVYRAALSAFDHAEQALKTYRAILAFETAQLGLQAEIKRAENILAKQLPF